MLLSWRPGRRSLQRSTRRHTLFSGADLKRRYTARVVTSSPPSPEALAPTEALSDADALGDSLLIAHLARQDLPCVRCGYNLRGTTRGRCPECGGSFRVGIACASNTPPSHSELGFLLAGVIGLSVGLGGFALEAFVHLWLAIFLLDGDSLRWLSSIAWLPGFSLLTASLVAWIRWRRRIARLPLGVRVLLLCACYGIIIASYGWLLGY